MAIDNGNATAFTPDSPTAAGIGALPTTPGVDPRSLSLLQPMAQSASQQIAGSNGQPGDWARGILSGAYKAMSGDLMKGFGAANTVLSGLTPTKGTGPMFNAFAAGLAGAQKARAQRSEEQIETMKANLEKARFNQLTRDDDLAQTQKQIDSNLAMAKEQGWEWQGSPVPMTSLKPADLESGHWQVVGMTPDGQKLVQQHTLPSFTVTDGVRKDLDTYLPGQFADLKVGQVVPGTEAIALSRAMTQVATLKDTAMRQQQFEDEHNIAVNQEADREAQKQATLQLSKYRDPRDPGNLALAYQGVQDAANNGDKDAQAALTALGPEYEEKMAELKVQQMKITEDSRTKLALGQLKANSPEALNLYKSDTISLGKAQDRLAKLQGMQAQLQKAPPNTVPALLNKFGYTSVPDLTSAVQQAQQEASAAQDMVNDDRNYFKSGGTNVKPPARPKNVPSNAVWNSKGNGGKGSWQLPQ